MNILAKYLLLILFLICQSAYAYNYDADTPSEQSFKITSDSHFKEYDDTSNSFTYREHEHNDSNSQGKTQDGSFFAFEVSLLAAKGPKVGGGAHLKNLSPGQQKRIQNAADNSGADITVVGSQTT